MMKGKSESEDSVMHRSVVLNTVNEKISQWSTDPEYISDSNIAAVALLAGYEVSQPVPCY